MPSKQVVSFILLALLAPCAAFCTPVPQDSLPDAPSSTDRSQDSRSLADTARVPFTTVRDNRSMVVKYDPLHMDAETHVAPTAPAWSRTLLQRTPAAHVSENSGVFGRAVSAASSVVISHDTDGNRKLNTPGLFRLLTVATAHVAETPYWRRTHAAPFADFGSMLGNDAGMNVFHIFQPDLMQIVKSREPKFVSRFQHSQK